MKKINQTAKLNQRILVGRRKLKEIILLNVLMLATLDAYF